MSLINKIKSDQLQSRKDRDTLKSSLLTTLIGEVQTQSKNTGRSEEDLVLDVILKFIKSIKQTLDLKVSKESEEELNILISYTPKQLTEEEIKDLIKSSIDSGNTNFGMIMKYFSTNFKGCYDTKQLPILVKKYT